MKKRIFVALSMLLTAFAVVLSAEPINLPSVAYRYDGEEKFEFVYDEYGHITSMSMYYLDVDDYVFAYSHNFEYYRLPNGDFIQTKWEDVSEKHISVYDSKGMMLLYESYWHEILEYGIRSVIDDNGIRTGIEEYDIESQQWILNPDYKFDHKGRIMECAIYFYYDDKDFKSTHKKVLNRKLKTKMGLFKTKKPVHSSSRSMEKSIISWTWSDNDQLIATSYQDDYGDFKVTTTFTEIETVKNGEYFNMYAIYPFWEDDYEFFYDYDIPLFAWDDFTSHKWVFNAKMIIDGYDEEFDGEYVMTSVYDDISKETTTIFSKDDYIFSTQIFKEENNGSWSLTGTGDPMYFYVGEQSKTYNDYGYLIRDYYFEGEEYEYWITEKTYNREYNDENCPVKTTYLAYFQEYYDGEFYEDEYEFEETYDSWWSSGIKSPVITAIKVYPTVTSGIIYIDKQENETVRLYNVFGIQLLEVQSQSIDISTYPKGLYFLKTGNGTAKIIKK